MRDAWGLDDFDDATRGPAPVDIVRFLGSIDLVGIFDSYAAAEDAWRGKAQATVDDAEMRYVIVHLHRLLEPESDGLRRPEPQAER